MASLNSTKDYLLMMENTTPIGSPITLGGHGLSDVNPETVERTTAVVLRHEKGRNVEKTIVLRPARQTGMNFTVQFGSEGAHYGPLLDLARRGNCDRNLFVKRLCAPNSKEEHFYVLTNPSFNPPTPPNGFITIDDTQVVTWQAEALAELLPVYQIGGFTLTDITEPLYAAAFIEQQCVDCDTTLFQALVVGGGTGETADAPILKKTTDRFGATTDLTTGIANGNVITNIYTRGDIILVSFADDPVVGTATTGGTAISTDGGSSFTLDSNITASMHGVTWFLDRYIAVGGTASGAGLMYTSTDGVTWTAVTSTSLPASHALTKIAVDTANEEFYVVGEGGTLLRGTDQGGSISLTAITLPGSPGTLLSVAVIGESYVAAGGASNYYAESWDRGVTWSQPSIPGTAAVSCIGGVGGVRSIVGTGTAFADRTILSDNLYKARSMISGSMTGDVMGGAFIEGEANYFVVVTDDGEVVLFRPIIANS